MQLFSRLHQLFRAVQLQLVSHIGIVMVTASLLLALYAYKIVDAIVLDQAIETARQKAELVTHFRNFYGDEIVTRAKHAGMNISHDYQTTDHTLPIPATLTIELGHYMSKQQDGTQVGLYSQHPFPWRIAERKLDAFQTDALQQLQKDPSTPYVRQDVLDGVKVLRYAQADRMLAQCVACHNQHPQSPRKDWKEGDVRGALEVVLPVKQWLFSGWGILNQSLLLFLALIFGGLLLIWRALRRLRYLATRDDLTKRLNRRGLIVRARALIAHALQQEKTGALVQLNLEHFKKVNDNHGHEVGNLLLQEVGRVLQAEVGDDGDVARLAGAEFVVLLAPSTDVAALSQQVDRLLGVFKQGFDIDGKRLHVSTHAGVAVYPDDGIDPNALLIAVDTAHSCAKASGRNECLFFEQKMQQDLMERLALEEAMREAIDKAQFELHYQPRVSASDGATRCAEVLIRWNHPELGRISPMRFIPIAEESGHIMAIGEWVLRTVARQLRVWQIAYPDLMLSVNLSPREFRDHSLVQRLRSVLSDIAPQSLEMELTESAAISDVQDGRRQLLEIRDIGIKTSLDDFGTGFSSLSYLRDFPVDALKIDKSFVDDVGKNEEANAIVQTIIDLAGKLNLGTVAEGVETEVQADLLKRMGVGELQGYFFARPMPTEDFSGWLAEHYSHRIPDDRSAI